MKYRMSVVHELSAIRILRQTRIANPIAAQIPNQRLKPDPKTIVALKNIKARNE